MTTSTTAALIKAARMLHDDCADYASINNLGGYNNHSMKAVRDAIAAIEAQPWKPTLRDFLGYCMEHGIEIGVELKEAIEAQQNTAGIELPGIRQGAATTSAHSDPASRTGLPSLSGPDFCESDNCEGGN